MDEIIDTGRMVDQEGISVAISSLTACADSKELLKRAQQDSKEVLLPKRMGLHVS